MKRNFCLVILFLSTSFFMYGQSADEKAIKDVLNEITTANTKDVSKLEPIYASDFIFISSVGKKYSKTERLAYLKSMPLPESFAFSNEQIRMYGSTAVVNAEVSIKPSGKDTENHLVTLVLVKRNGRWLEVNGQATPKAAN